MLTIVVLNSYGQNIFNDLRSNERRGDFYYSRLSYAKAIYFYTQALQKKKNKNKYELNRKAAGLYKKMAMYKEAKECFENIVVSGHQLTEQDSIQYFNLLKASSNIDGNSRLAKIYSGKILSDFFRDSLYYEVNELSFNTVDSEYCPVSIANGLLYISDKASSSLVQKYNAVNGGGFASLYFRQKKDSVWSNAEEIPIPIEDVLHVGPVAFYNHQQNAIINICVKDVQKPYRLLLYQARYDSTTKRFSEIYPMPFNNKSYSVGHPAISETGETIFFVSDRTTSNGGTDLYVSNFINGQWTDPVNLGTKINTKGDEQYPYLSKDSILFFASDGRYGMGGMDIYYTDLSFGDTMVFNMGAPVNSMLDDFSFYYNEKKKEGYFSSNRKGDGKQDDLFLMREHKICLTLRIKDDFDKTDLLNVEVQILDIELNNPIKYYSDIQEGCIKSFLRPEHQYKIILQKEDYRNDTILVSTFDSKDTSVLKEIYLKRKYIYYGNLKLTNEEFKNSKDTATIVVNNITVNKLDTIACVNSSLVLKLDAECEYIVTSRNKDILRYIYLERKPIKNLATKSFYNMYLSSAKPTVFRVILKKCQEEKNKVSDFLIPSIKVMDWVNGNEFIIVPGPDGDFQFVITDVRLFNLLIGQNKILYSRQEKQSEGFCFSFID